LLSSIWVGDAARATQTTNSPLAAKLHPHRNPAPTTFAPRRPRRTVRRALPGHTRLVAFITSYASRITFHASWLLFPPP
jgi:hypothetical protein